MMENFIGHGQARVIGLTLAVCLLGLSGCERLKSYTDQEYLQKAKTAQSQGKLQEAVINLKNALQKNPNNAEARWLLGEAYVTLEQGRDAEKELQRAQELGINPESLKAPMGRALLLQGLYKRALDETQPGPDSSQGAIARMLEIQGQAQLGLGKLEGCLLFQQSQQKDAGYVPAYWGLARCAAVQGKPDVARAELQKALKLEDKNSDTWSLLGDLERDNKRLIEAEAAYTSALQRKPGNLNALFGRAAVRVQNNSLKEAGQDLDTAAKIAKDHPIVTHLRGVIQFKNRNYTDAKTSFETALKATPGYLPAILWLGFTNTALKNYQQAAQQFTQYTRHYPKAVQIQALLAAVQIKMGDREQAEKTLTTLQNINIDDPQSLSALGRIHLAIGENELATQYLQRVVEHEPAKAESRADLAVALLQKGENTRAIEELEKSIQLNADAPEADEILIQTLMRNKQFDKALQAIDALQAKQPNSPVPHNYRGGVLLMEKDQEGARRSFLKALELQPGYPPAAHNLAQLALSKQNLDEARSYYQKILDHNKDHLPTLLALSQLELKAQHQEKAKEILEHTMRKYPEVAEPAVFLGRNYLNTGNPSKALEVSQAASRAHPDDLGLLEVRGLAYLMTGDAGNALGNFKYIVQLRPDSADANFYLSTAHAALNDAAATRTALLQALKLQPSHPRAKAALARLNLNEGKLDEALRLSRELQQESQDSPEGMGIEAEIYLRQKDYPKAIQVVEAAVKKFPEQDALVFALARTRWAAGDKKGGLANVLDWQKSHPDDIRAPVFLGGAYLELGREQEAIAAFEAILKKTPNDPKSLNNLAWLLRKSEPARALELAEKANKVKPDDFSMLDTLGWLEVEQGKTKQGLEKLQKAFELAPDVPLVHYHYASALAKAGEKALARRELERLLSSGKKFPEETEARALLKQL
ncbi:MAG: PEP-CTERM system TPR-repeat protein PrsT [Gammaproteobacteria bacterium]|nr:PEP-CTERM system TPR-repeat protein PrsT [Gammaproteobacteria bacterium]